MNEKVQIKHEQCTACKQVTGIIVDFGKKKHLKNAPFQGKKSTFLAKKAPISQTKSPFGAEKST